MQAIAFITYIILDLFRLAIVLAGLAKRNVAQSRNRILFGRFGL